jgi:hypothetical protein
VHPGETDFTDLLESLPRESDVGSCHLYKVALLARGLAVTDTPSHLRRVANVRNFFGNLFQAAAEVVSTSVDDLEKEERFHTLGKTIEQDVSLDVVEVEFRHGGVREVCCEKQDDLCKVIRRAARLSTLYSTPSSQLHGLSSIVHLMRVR